MSEQAPAAAVEVPPARGGAVAFIFVTVLLDMLALGVVLPILPKLVESFVDNDTAQAARIFGLFGTAWALMQFVFSPILGAVSDRFGRRPVVLHQRPGGPEQAKNPCRLRGVVIDKAFHQLGQDRQGSSLAPTCPAGW